MNNICAIFIGLILLISNRVMCQEQLAPTDCPNASLKVADTVFLDHFITSFKSTDAESTPLALFSKRIEQIQLPETATEHLPVIDIQHNLRIDLMAKDFIDQVELILDRDKPNFSYYQKTLQEILAGKPVSNFMDWYLKLIEFSEDDKKLQRLLNNNLVFQVYDARGIAQLHSVKVTGPNFRERIKRNQLILKYNKLALDPEAQGILSTLSHDSTEPFSLKSITVTKMHKLKKTRIKKAMREHYEQFCTELLEDGAMEGEFYEVQCNPTRKNVVSLKIKRGAPKQYRQTLKPLFDSIYSSNRKYEYFSLLQNVNGDREFSSTPTPADFLENLDSFDDEVKEATYHQLLGSGNDEITLALRKWIHRHRDEINQALVAYNNEHDPDINFSINSRFRVRAHEAIEQYESLLKIFPDAPWIEQQEYSFVTDEGRKVLTGKNFARRLFFRINELAKTYVNPEGIASYGAGVGVALLTGGNIMAGAITKTIVHDAVRGYRYDHSFKNSFNQTPYRIVSSVVNSAGFASGAIPYSAFAGSVTGGLRSILTGQDLQKGIIVGAGFGALRSALPYDVAFPTIQMSPGDVADAAYATKAVLLDAGTNAIYHGAQGATVAVWDKRETARSGLIKGATYGAAESLVLSSLFGVRYDMFGLIPENRLQKQFAQEARFHNKVDTHGIDHRNYFNQLDSFWDAAYGIDYRIATGNWGWYTENVMGGDASFSSPWFITGPKGHFSGAGTIAHEVSHQVQYRDIGAANFLIGYSIEAIKDGTRGSHINHDEAELISDQDFNMFEQYQSHGYGH